MNPKGFARSVLILGVIGALVSAQQVCGESVFAPKGARPLEQLVIEPRLVAAAGPGDGGSGEGGFSMAAADTVETFEIQVEEDKGPGMVKQLAIFAVLTAVAGYAVFTLLDSDDEAEPEDNGGKNPPVSFAAPISIPFSRSR